MMEVMEALPTIYVSHETLRIGIGPRRQLHETVGTSETEEIPRSIRRPRVCPWAAPLVVFNDDRQEIREGVFEGHRSRQGQPFGRGALRTHRFGDGGNDVADQAHQRE